MAFICPDDSFIPCLLAGEKDHYIPNDQFYRLSNKIRHAKSLTTRMFTEAEGGEQHCQTGNYQLAVDGILNWMNQQKD